MEIKTFSLVTYSKVPESRDGITYAFEFKCVSKEKIGAPDEQLATKLYHIIVRISGTLIALWNLENDDLIKILYWIAHEAIEKNPYQIQQDIDLHTGNTPSTCQYDPKRIIFPGAISFDVEVAKRIGF